MALGDELAVLTGACALCVQCARTRTLLRNSMPRFAVVVACMPHALGNHMPRRMVASAWAPNAEAIGSERDSVVRITVELVEVTLQGRREGTRCRSDPVQFHPRVSAHDEWPRIHCNRGSSLEPHAWVRMSELEGANARRDQCDPQDLQFRETLAG